MKHVDLAKQRTAIAKHIRAGKSLSWVAMKYGICQQTIRNACAENGVTMPSPRTKKETMP